MGGCGLSCPALLLWCRSSNQRWRSNAVLIKRLRQDRRGRRWPGSCSEPAPDCSPTAKKKEGCSPRLLLGDSPLERPKPPPVSLIRRLWVDLVINSKSRTDSGQQPAPPGASALRESPSSSAPVLKPEPWDSHSGLHKENTQTYLVQGRASRGASPAGLLPIRLILNLPPPESSNRKARVARVAALPDLHVPQLASRHECQQSPSECLATKATETLHSWEGEERWPCRPRPRLRGKRGSAPTRHPPAVTCGSTPEALLLGRRARRQRHRNAL